MRITDVVRKQAPLLLGVAAFAMAFAHSDAARAVSSQISNVFVTNDSAHALPVAITSAPPATVNDGSGAVTLVFDIFAQDPLGLSANLSNLDGSKFFVPAGKRLVIDSAFGFGSNNGDQSTAYAWIAVNVVGPAPRYVTIPFVIHDAAQFPNGDATARAQVAAVPAPVHAFAEAGDFPLVFVKCTQPSEYCSFNGTVFGHLVDAP